MIKKETILSTTDDRLTLLQWLKKVEQALKDSTAVGFKAAPTDDGKVVFEIDFADGSAMMAEPIAVPNVLNEFIEVNKETNRTVVGTDLDVDGSAILVGGHAYRILQYGDSTGNVLEIQNQDPSGIFRAALTIRANNNGNYLALLHSKQLATFDDVQDLRMDAAYTYSKARYQHTVLMTFPYVKASFAFTAMSSINTPIDSLTDLATVFGGCRIAGSGGQGTGGKMIFIDMHASNPSGYWIATIKDDGTIQEATIPNLGAATITDDVCIPN